MATMNASNGPGAAKELAVSAIAKAQSARTSAGAEARLRLSSYARVASASKPQSAPDAPRVTLNRHCSACEFRVACRQAAESSDDLSLLQGLSEKEVEKHRQRG